MKCGADMHGGCAGIIIYFFVFSVAEQLCVSGVGNEEMSYAWAGMGGGM